MRSSKLKIWFWAECRINISHCSGDFEQKKTNAPEIEIEKVEARVIQSTLYLERSVHMNVKPAFLQRVGKMEKVFVKEGYCKSDWAALVARLMIAFKVRNLDQLSAGVKSKPN